MFLFNCTCRSDRFKPIVVDPGTYLARRSQIFQATEKRATPDAFKLFTGKYILRCVQHIPAYDFFYFFFILNAFHVAQVHRGSH